MGRVMILVRARNILWACAASVFEFVALDNYWSDLEFFPVRDPVTAEAAGQVQVSAAGPKFDFFTVSDHNIGNSNDTQK